MRSAAGPTSPSPARGVCGTCRTKIVDGKVDMRRNFALEKSEVDAGLVLTCQSHPMSEQVTVD